MATSKAASKKVGEALHAEKVGTLKSGSTGKKVTSRKQAIAIGLAEARKAGADVPPPAERGAGTNKAAAKKAPANKAPPNKAPPKKAAAKPAAKKT